MEHFEFLIKLFNWQTEKVQEASFFSALIAIMSLISENLFGLKLCLLLGLILIMLADLVTGRAAAKMRGEKMISKRGLNWAFKLGSYFTFMYIMNKLPMQAAFCDASFMITPIKITHLYLLLHILFWETKSIDENFEALGYDIRILKLFDVIFDMLKTKMNPKK